MKILILEIGRRENKKKYSGFSLLEIIVVISIISILGIIIGLSTNFINSSNENPSIEKKLILIQNEIDYLKKYSLAVKSPIKLIEDETIVKKVNETMTSKNVNPFIFFPLIKIYFSNRVYFYFY